MTSTSVATSVANSTFLRRVLLVDATASGGMGVLFLLAAGPMESLLGLPATLLRGVGLFLIPFAGFLVWLFYWMVPYPNSRYLWPNFQSPLMWDFIAINTYLTGSVTYLYLPMIPDMAVARDKATGFRKKMYRILALGWRGTEREWVRLEKAISIS